MICFKLSSGGRGIPGLQRRRRGGRGRCVIENARLTRGGSHSPLARIVGKENVIAGTDCGLGGRVHPQIAWAKLRALRDGAAIASKKLWS